MIYAIRAVGTEFVKIGIAKSVGQRLKQMETGCPFELHIEAVANWPDDEERRLHIYLRSSYFRGEWFKDGELLNQAIDLLRSEDGLERWRGICEQRRILAAKTVTQERKPKDRQLKAMSKYERRLLERRAWWAAKLKQRTDSSEEAISQSSI